MRYSNLVSIVIVGMLGGWLINQSCAQDASVVPGIPPQFQSAAWTFQDSSASQQPVSQDAQESLLDSQSVTQSIQDAQSSSQLQTEANDSQGPGLTSSVEDPTVELKRIKMIRAQAKTPGDSLFRSSPLTPIRERTIAMEKRLYAERDIKFGANLNTLFQGLTDNIPGTDDYGMSSFGTLVGSWDGFRKGCPNQGELTIGLESRWNWGTTDPTTLGNVGLGSLTFTSNPFTTYTPTVLVRNLYWRQGSREAGWMYRMGRVTPDQFLSTSQHVTPLTINLPIAGTGAFSMGLPDSGMGMFGGLFLSENVNIAGVVSDANADRTKYGQIQEGDLFTAVELQAKILPRTKNAGYSKLTFWHNDGTKFGDAINGSTGKEGWGFFLKGEQELSSDGRVIGLLRYGKGYRESALYEQLAAGHLLVYDPFNAGRFKRRGFNADLAGFVYSWITPTGVDRDESNFEFFYRFALFPEMQATLSYQAIVNPALDPTNDFGSAFSFRLRSTW